MIPSGFAVNTLGILAFIADIYLGRTADVDPPEKRQVLAYGCGAITVVFLVLNALLALNPSVPNAVFLILSFLQGKWTQCLLYALILFLAVYPSYLAKKDRAKSSAAANPEYVWKNCLFNCAGAISAIVMLWIIHEEITDLRFLEYFYIEEIIQLLFPICMAIAFSYQSIEQKNKDNLDHDPSLNWPNQMWNLVHLFNTYFWALFSGAMMLSYTRYCHIYHMPLILNWRYLLFLSMALIFFYSCGNHSHEYIHMIFLTGVPAFLIGSLQWMSWFTMDEQMNRFQMLFVAVHLFIYMTIIYAGKNLIVWKKGNHTKIEYPALRQWFWGVPLIVTLVMYSILWLVPTSLGADRVSLNYAGKCLIMICQDTSKDPAELLNEIKNAEWFDSENERMDRTRFLLFLYENLQEELISKEVIPEKAQTLTYEELDTWIDDSPLPE